MLDSQSVQYHQEAIKKLKNQKAAGIDDIPGEHIKQADVSVAIILQKLCNRVWKSKIWQEERKNHRAIALIHHASKILTYIKRMP